MQWNKETKPEIAQLMKWINKWMNKATKVQILNKTSHCIYEEDSWIDCTHWLWLENQWDTMKRVCQADDLFVCFGGKQNKGLGSRSRRDRKRARELQSEKVRKRNPKKAVSEGWRRGSVDNGQKKEEWGKASQDDLAFLVAL